MLSASFTQSAFGDAASDACDNDPNCHGVSDANGNLVNWTCTTLTADPAQSGSPCYNASAAGLPGVPTSTAAAAGSFSTTQAALTGAAAQASHDMLVGIALMGAVAMAAVVGVVAAKRSEAAPRAAFGRRARRYPRFY